MRFRDLLYETWQSLMANKGRNFLTILGVVIGIAAVISMTSMIGGIRQGLFSEMGMDQSRMVNIYASSPSGAGLTMSDLDRMERNLPGYELLTGTVSGSVQVTGENDKVDIYVEGVEPDYFVAQGMTAKTGKLFGEEENKVTSKIAVIDESLARALFGNNVDPLGRTVKIGDMGACTVVGTVASSSSMPNAGYAYVPLQAAMPFFGQGNGQLGQITGFAREGVDPADLAQQTSDYLAKLWNVSDSDRDTYIWISTMQEIIDQVDSFIGAFQVLMTSVAGVSLLVGGIGIMNMMLTNVTERIREIGLRKALGARRSSIVAQFLCESITLTLVGGVFGTILGYAGSWLLMGVGGSLFLGEDANVAPAVSPDIALTAVAICLIVGVLFGIYPAQRAAKLDPVESLRHQ